MFGFLVLITFVGCYVYAYIAIKDQCIVMRMPDGERIRYDKASQARGYYVSLGLFVILPWLILILYLLEQSE